jgi:colanic acid biosynthesis protein WcaH
MILHESNPSFIEDDHFRIIVENTPLVSVDLIVRHNNRVLLGRRVNKPACCYWFTLGGRVLKNEAVRNAIKRISKLELGIIIPDSVKFIGVFEHLYDDSIFDDVSTHYLNLAYEVEISDLQELPKDQHSEYRWFEPGELLESREVHPYVKDYFTEEKGTVPQKKENNV